jgi:Domain of unknown function (DUF5916)/Carbohydrate family 9 binding domain-like
VLPFALPPLEVTATAPQATPHLAALRVRDAPKLDGVLDDAAWKGAPATSAFTQKFPDEGQAPSERTTVRIVYDDEAVYVAFDCEQVKSKIVPRLTRRGRLVESDWVSIALGTRGDGKSAYEFVVNASGVLVDTLRFNDTQTAENWDENWDARTNVTARGWTAELKIPLHILRFPDVASQSWTMQAKRRISERQETDEWSFIPRAAGGEVSRYGRLDGLTGLTAQAPLEVRPFVVGRLEHRDPASTQLAHGTDFTASAGLDLKWHPTYDLALDATVNPDFAQVEADQLVLNLTNFETYYPEKRPFFLEGVDVFSTPIQLLYTRRIGRAPDAPQLLALSGSVPEQLVDVPTAPTIYGASKLTGRVADGWTIGTLQAITAKNDVQVQLGDSLRYARPVEPLATFNVLRVKRELGDKAFLGIMGTAVDYAEPTGGYARLPGGQQLCPNAVDTTSTVRSLNPALHAGPASAVPAGSRCFNNAYVVGVDGQWRSEAGDWLVNGQAVASELQNGSPRHVPDGTTIRPGDVGTGVVATVSKEGGKHWVGALNGEFNDRKLDVNDLGFDRRANNYRWRLDLEYRELEKWWVFLEAHAKFEYFDRYNLDGRDLGGGYQLNVSGTLDNYWKFFTEAHYRTAYFDDREVGDGTALQRSGLVGYELEVESDPTKKVAFHAETQTQWVTNGGLVFNGTSGVLFRVLTQLDLEVLPTAVYTFGEPRFVGLAGAPSHYLFGKLEAKALGATLRATYTFTPRLTLQTYGQLLVASGHYDRFSSFTPTGPRAAVKVGDLVPFNGLLPTNPDFEEAVLNVNAVVRWEYRLGSTLFLVYTRAQQPNVTLGPSDAAGLHLGSVGKGPATDVVLVKLAYWFG